MSGGWFDLITIPAAVSTLKRADDQINAAFGIFVPEQIGFGERLTLRARDGSAWQLTNDESGQTFYAGGGVAWKLSPTLRLGAALFGTYRQTSTSTQIFGSYGDPAHPFLTSTSFREQLQTLGLELGGGIQWEPLPGLHLGASIRTFGLQLFTRFRRVGGTASAEDGTVRFEPADLGDLHPSVQLVSPAKLQLGIAYEFNGAVVTLDGTLAHALENPAVGVSRDVLWNLRAGARFRVDRQILMGVGLFTDRSAGRPPSGFGENRIDNYGISWGISIDNPHELGASEPADDLVFVTFVGVRYALGVGRHGGFLLDPTAPADQIVQGTSVQTLSHDLSLYLGSSLFF